MSELKFHDEYSLSETAEKLAKEAMKSGLISSFTVHFFPDSWQFFIPNERESEPLTPEEAYLHLNKLMENSKNQVS